MTTTIGTGTYYKSNNNNTNEKMGEKIEEIKQQRLLFPSEWPKYNWSSVPQSS